MVDGTRLALGFVLAAMLVAASTVPFVDTAEAAAPPGFSDARIASGLDLPTAMEFAPDGRLFVSEKGGDLRIIKNGALLAQPFVTIAVNSQGERGLLGIAFDPDFESNGYVYVYYTTSTDPVHNRVSRFTVNPSNPDTALVGSEVRILDLEPLNTESHNGGALGFGPDGKLYVSTGDNYFPYYSQSLTSRFGKILRINPDGSIPTDNPFYNVQGAYKEIWALGLRNPFTFQFSQDGTKMHIADVGQSNWEEINIGLRGANYGWPTCEGTCSNPEYVDPIYAYAHPTDGSGSSITGGPFYDSGQFPPEYEGSYFFGDYVKGFVSRLTPTNQVQPFLTGINTPVGIQIGPDGSLYYLSIFPGEVHKVTYGTPGNSFPSALASANPISGQPPLAVSFDGSASSDPDGDALTYSWNFGDSSSASGALAVHTYDNAGSYTATLTVNDGKGGFDTDTVEISVGNRPVAVIQTPSAGATYNAGDTISFGGSGTDAEDGILPSSAFSWTVLFHHNTHTHPFQEFNGVTGASFTIPTTGETADDVWYRIHLTVTDSDGLTHTVTRDVVPNKSTVTLASSTPGLTVLLDGHPRVTPYTFVGVVGVTRVVEAPESQNLAGALYSYQSWSDSGARVHTISTPPQDTTFTATFSEGGVAPARTLTVHGVDFAGNILSMYTTVSLDGNIVATGFTPFTFSGTEGVTYVVGVQDFGSATFDHWENGSTARARTVTLNLNTELTAFYRTSDAPPPNSYNLSVRSADLSGNSITGYYTAISENDAVAHTGYTPVTYLGQPGHRYAVAVSDFGSATFDHWENGSTERTRIVDLSTSLIITAYFSTEPLPPPPDPDPVLTVTSVNESGGAIAGYYTTIYQNGSIVQTGFTPMTFTGQRDAMYGVEVQDFGNFVFDHWDDASTVRARSIVLTSDVILTAHYRDTSDVIAPTVSASPTGGTYGTPQSVSLNASEPATIYYTTDGTQPTTSSLEYAGPIDIESDATLRFFAVDAAGNTGMISTETYLIETTVSYPIVQMSDTTSTFGLATHSGQQSHVEFVSPTSQLIGKSIDQITMKLRKTGSPVGQAEIGVFNANLSVKKSFGTIVAGTITSTYTDYVFSLPNNELYTIQAGDRIGIKYTGGNSANFIAVMLDQDPADPFDGTNSYRQQFTTSWISSTPNDLYMILEQTHGSTDIIPPTVMAFPAGGQYTIAQSVTLSADETATIYYTTDGSTPTTSSSVYSTPLDISTSTTLRFFAVDVAGNTGSIVTEVYTIQPISFPVTHMSGTTQTYGLTTNSAAQSHVEFVSPTSELIGKSLDEITLKLRKTGSPGGTFEVGVFNADLSVKKSFGNMTASSVASTYTDYTFSLSGVELYTIQAGDRIGIKYTDGNSTNFIAVMIDRDPADPFDGTNSYRQQFTTSWANYPTDDMYMILRQTHG